MKTLLFTIPAFLSSLFMAQAQNFTDPRDGRVYRTVTIGETTWFAENLNFKIEDSYCYDNDDSNCHTYGRLY